MSGERKYIISADQLDRLNRLRRRATIEQNKAQSANAQVNAFIGELAEELDVPWPDAQFDTATGEFKAPAPKALPAAKPPPPVKR